MVRGPFSGFMFFFIFLQNEVEDQEDKATRAGSGCVSAFSALESGRTVHTYPNGNTHKNMPHFSHSLTHSVFSAWCVPAPQWHLIESRPPTHLCWAHCVVSRWQPGSAAAARRRPCCPSPCTSSSPSRHAPCLSKGPEERKEAGPRAGPQWPEEGGTSTSQCGPGTAGPVRR